MSGPGTEPQQQPAAPHAQGAEEQQQQGADGAEEGRPGPTAAAGAASHGNRPPQHDATLAHRVTSSSVDRRTQDGPQGAGHQEAGAEVTQRQQGAGEAVAAHEGEREGQGAAVEQLQPVAPPPELAKVRVHAVGEQPASSLLGLVGYDGHPVDAVVGVRRVRGPGDTPLGARALQQSGGGSVDGHGGGPQHFASPAVMMMMAVDSPSKRLDMLAGGWRARAHAKRGDRRFVHRRDGVATLAAALQ